MYSTARPDHLKDHQAMNLAPRKLAAAHELLLDMVRHGPMPVASLIACLLLVFAAADNSRY